MSSNRLINECAEKVAKHPEYERELFNRAMDKGTASEYAFAIPHHPKHGFFQERIEFYSSGDSDLKPERKESLGSGRPSLNNRRDSRDEY